MPERCVIGVAPDFRAEGEKAVRLALGEGRIREQRGRDRLQRERHAQLLDHVGFRREVEIGLHRAGPVHHVEAEIADLRHVLRHDAVAALRHDRNVGAASISASCRARESRCRAGARLRAPARDAPSARCRSGARSRAARRTIRTVRRAPARSRRRRSRRSSPMMLSRSMIGSQPSRSCMPSSSARMPRGPSYGTGL